MINLAIVVLSACFISASQARIAPAFIEKCPGLNQECLLNSVQKAIPDFTKGIPELGIKTTDPLMENTVKLDLPGAFKVQLHNGTLTGLRKCIVESVDYKAKADQAEMGLRCNVTIKGRYKAKGNILIVQINGDGDAKIKITDVIINAKIKFGDVIRDGVTYYDIKDLNIKHKFGGRVSFSMTNLFQGNPQLSEAVLTFLNENWLQISEEFGGPVFDKLVDIIFKEVQTFFRKIPKDELY